MGFFSFLGIISFGSDVYSCLFSRAGVNKLCKESSHVMQESQSTMAELRYHNLGKLN